MTGKKRDYGRIERHIWTDHRFHALGPDGKELFLLLLSAPGAYRVPGLVNGTSLSLLEWLNWVEEMDGDIDGAVERVEKAQVRLIEAGWMKVDSRARLLYLPKAVDHERPTNVSHLIGWLTVLTRDVPESPLRHDWIRDAYRTMRKCFGINDSRSKLLRRQINYLNKKGSTSLKLPENINEADTLSSGNGQAAFTNNSSSNSSNSKDSNTTTQGSLSLPYDPKNNNKQGGAPTSPVGSSAPAKAKIKCKKRQKHAGPPVDFDERQMQIWDALRTAKFHVPGVGEQTVFDNVGNPEQLARELGGPGYPAVDIGLIYRLATWTQQNPGRGKKLLGRFLVNRFSYSQERGGRGNGTPSQQLGDRALTAMAPAIDDLEAKVENTRK